MADVDEALVEEVVRVAYAASEGPIVDPAKAMTDWDRDVYYAEARAVLAHLAATGRLVGEGEERVEWGVDDRATNGPIFMHYDDVSARDWAKKFGGLVVTRTVRTWTTPDGATGTLVGPWVEVQP